MAADHLQFGLLFGLVVFVIDSEELESVAVDFRLSDDVAHRHLNVRFAV